MTKRQREILRAMADGAIIWWMDTKAMWSQHPCLCVGQKAQPIRRSTLRILDDLDYVRATSTRDDGYKITKKGRRAVMENIEQKKLIPVEQFGKDHWSTFAYIECRCVDNQGVPNHRHMRTDFDRHAELAHVLSMTNEILRAKYPTITKAGCVDDHDDWDCADDLAREGLIEIVGTGLHPVFKMTEKGKAVASKLRAHKASGGSFGNFIYEA